MPVVINMVDGTIDRTCDIPDCGVEVVGLLRCTCGYNEHIYCPDHECTQCRESGDTLPGIGNA